MTRRITFITAVAAAALVVGVPAAFADPWGADRQDSPSVVGSPDLVDRVIAARQKEQVAMLDARERSLGPLRGDVSTPIVVTYRPLVGDGGDRFVIDGGSTPATVTASGSGREIEWPQIGFGVLLGIVLALGLTFVMRTTRSRELAH